MKNNSMQYLVEINFPKKMNIIISAKTKLEKKK